MGLLIHKNVGNHRKTFCGVNGSAGLPTMVGQGWGMRVGWVMVVTILLYNSMLNCFRTTVE